MEATLEITQRTSAAWVVYEEVGSQYELRVDQATKLDPGVGVRRALDELSFGHVAGASFGGGADYHDTHELIPIFGSQFAMRPFTSAPE